MFISDSSNSSLWGHSRANRTAENGSGVRRDAARVVCMWEKDGARKNARHSKSSMHEHTENAKWKGYRESGEMHQTAIENQLHREAGGHTAPGFEKSTDDMHTSSRRSVSRRLLSMTADCGAAVRRPMPASLHGERTVSYANCNSRE